MNLEGTPEFNRSFRAIVGDLNDDMYQHYVDEVVEPMQLDEYSKEYHPFQQIVPDTRVGFDENGDFHVVASALTPHRWADYLQDALTNYISTFDYTVGASERDDIVQDIVSERMEALESNLERYQLEKALELWRQKYRYGIRP